MSIPNAGLRFMADLDQVDDSLRKAAGGLNSDSGC